MGSLFSSGKSPKGSHSNSGTSRPPRKDEEITSKDRAILDLKNSKDRLKKYRKKVSIHNLTSEFV
jgi:hypothetical protein